MGQQFSTNNSETETTVGCFAPPLTGGRKRRLPGSDPKSLLFVGSDDNEALSRATESTFQSSTKRSVSPPSPLGSSSGTYGSIVASPNQHANHIHQPVALRYTTSTRNLQKTDKESAITTTTTISPSRPRVQTDPNLIPPKGHNGIRTLLKPRVAPADKRSNSIKLPRKRSSEHPKADSSHPSASHHSHGTPPNASYLERMYDSRTWEMYRRITSHREKVEAFNAANAAAKRNQNDDDRNSTNQTYMSDPVQRVTNSSTMEGGVDYGNFYDPGMNDVDGEESREGGVFLREDHSAPPYHHHRQRDNGQHHHGGFYHSNAETYSEWEHMNGDDVGASGNGSTNVHGEQHEAIFLFDFDG